jgi:hypothetical protein
MIDTVCRSPLCAQPKRSSISLSAALSLTTSSRLGHWRRLAPKGLGVSLVGVAAVAAVAVLVRAVVTRACAMIQRQKPTPPRAKLTGMSVKAVQLPP